MKRQIKALLISFAAIVLLVGAFFAVKIFVKPAEKPEEPIIGSYQLINENYKTAQKIEISNNNGEFTINRLEDSVFGIAEFEGYPQDKANYTLLFSGISKFTSTDKIVSPENLEPYGLKNPEGKAKIYYDNENSYTIYVGGQSLYSETEGRYVRIEGDENVYVLDSSTADLILAKKTDFISLAITNESFENLTDILNKAEFSGSKITPFSIVPAQVTYDGENYNDSFKIDMPYDIFIDDDKAGTVFSTLFNLFASGIEVLGYNDSDLAKYGLDNPATICKLSYGEESEIIISLGNKSEEGYYYMITDQYRVIYRISEHYAETLADISPASVMSTSPVLPSISLVDNMIIDYGGERYDYKITSDPSDKTYLKIEKDGEEIRKEDFQKFYSTALLYKVTDIADTSKEGEPTLRIEYVYSDDAKGSDIVEFYNIGERKYKVVKNSAAGYITKSTSVKDITDLLEKLISGERIVADE